MEVIRRRREAAPTRVAFSGKPEIMMVQGPSRWMRLRYLFIFIATVGFWEFGENGKFKEYNLDIHGQCRNWKCCPVP